MSQSSAPETRAVPIGVPAPSAIAADLADALEAVRRGERSIAEVSLAGAMLAGADLSGLDLSGCDLSGAELSRADLRGTRLFSANLSGAALYAARLDGADCTCADFTGANLSEASCEGTGFGRATLRDVHGAHARMRKASLTDSVLADASFPSADFTEARLSGADLDGAAFELAEFSGADLSGSSIAGTSFDRASLRGAEVCGLRSHRTASFLHVDVRDTDFSRSYLLREFIQDQNYIDEFRRQGRVQNWTFWVWWATSDCGRSIVRWGTCAAVIAMVFAYLYTLVDIDYGAQLTPLSPIYFSVVTFTTLGYGDVLPRSAAAQALVIAEVIAGYVMLGGLLSLITNKLARRAT